MKRFLAANFLAAAFATHAMGCAIEMPDHNYYMFSVFQRECMSPAFTEGINEYWKNYAGDNGNNMTEFFKWCNADIVAAAKKKGDSQMLTYLKWLNLYTKTCESISADSWDYPSKQQLAERRRNLTLILNNAKAYSGTRLKSQYALLRMRANMVLGMDNENAAFWNSTASRLPQSVWKEAMRNIYARALSKSGHRMKACDIYAEQGDMESIKWIARKYRNLAGIQSIYRQNPNAPTLTYLVQDFVNNAQQTMDLKPKTKEDKEWIETIGAKTVYGDEVKDFIIFADNVAKEGKTATPCLWKSATAMLHYLFGENAKAVEDVNTALSLDGTPRMKDNARAIRLLALTASHTLSPDFTEYLKGELEWLDRKIVEERSGRLEFANHYTEVMERVVFKNLAPLYARLGKPEMATALMGMMQKYGNDFQAEAAKYLDCAYGRYSDYTIRLDAMTAEDTENYMAFISSDHEDALEKYVCGKVYSDPDFFNEMIGTKFIAEGRFGEAKKFLEKVSRKFICGQRINFYMSQRSFSVERWFKRQKPVDEEGFLYTDFADTYGKDAGNKKLMFCDEMLGLLNRYSIMRPGDEKCSLAYELAVRYYQASCHGDCWFLTHYAKSVADTTRAGELDFTAEAIKYLEECRQSGDMKLRYKALYALAFIPAQPWCKEDYDSNFNTIYLPQPSARQYKAMEELCSFAKNHPLDIDEHTSRCDILKRFSQLR